ncbi:hypothetical protein DKX38_002918 [Salix brachista]|uniref:Carbohydrate kinase PfkB domain-containing protein n=1 Tax=Salix brachista TaxID=2182728 RepID=A0A5N5NND1_9ROSI|nr:hypothetical protein DKX38_002918 [Salix brachista]
MDFEGYSNSSQLATGLESINQHYHDNVGCRLSYDLNLRLPLWPSEEAARKGIVSIWNGADIIKKREEELEFLTEGADRQDDNVEFKGKVSRIKVDAADTTGAGNSFV